MKQRNRVAGHAVNPRQRAPGGEFEQLVQELRHLHSSKAQRQRMGFGADAALFVRKPRPAKKPLLLLVGSSTRTR